MCCVSRKPRQVAPTIRGFIVCVSPRCRHPTSTCATSQIPADSIQQLYASRVVFPPDGRKVPGGWWPPLMLDPKWIRENHHRFDVFDVHFGFDAIGPAVLAEVEQELKLHDKPLVYTLHDLRNPHHTEPDEHAEQQVAVGDRPAFRIEFEGAGGAGLTAWRPAPASDAPRPLVWCSRLGSQMSRTPAAARSTPSPGDRIDTTRWCIIAYTERGRERYTEAFTAGHCTTGEGGASIRLRWFGR